MTESEPIKVYELAKELSIDSLSLVEKLKELKIEVKNHMSSLPPEAAEVARTALASKKSPASKTTKKTASSKTKAKTKSSKVIVRSRKKTADDEVAPATEKEVIVKSDGSSPIVRRRTTLKSTSDVSHEAASETESSLSQSESTADQIEENQETLDLQNETSQVAKTEAEDQAITAATEQTDPTPAQKAPAKTEVKKTAPTFSSKPLINRVTIETKSLLKVIEKPKEGATQTEDTPPQAKRGGPVKSPAHFDGTLKGTTQDRAGVKIIKMTKENIDQMAEEEAARKKGLGRVDGVKPEDVRLDDYRKKEMIFLPKKKKLPVGKVLKSTQITTPKAQKRVVEFVEAITAKELAAQLGIKSSDVIKKLMSMGQMATLNDSLDFDTASLICTEYQYEAKNIAFKEEAVLESAEDAEEDLVTRPPIITVMGHVDHGKTSLLDAIRETSVVDGEAGGITQHIGAYTIEKNGHKMTFIDTPGHEAFTMMRARGATVTDIVILVVAADDGPMPQTLEALGHAKAAKVPIIVAVNKIDKPGATPDKVKQVLAEHDLLAEDWGGETMFIGVSALQRTNLDQLLEAILLNTEILELKANPNAKARGTVLESRIEKGRGPVVSILIKRGTLKIGDNVVAGLNQGRVKALTDHTGKLIDEVLPGMAAEILGFDGNPNPGEQVDAVENEIAARKIISHRQEQERIKKSTKTAKMSLDDLFAKVEAGETKDLNVILKADVGGSVEAVKDSLEKLSTDKVKVKVIYAGTGGITENDVLLSTASSGIILGFNVRPETKARSLAESEQVEIKCYNIIYELLDDVKKAMAGLLDKKKIEKFLGRAEVRQTFSVPKLGTIAGSSVIDGKITRNANVRLLRDSRIVFEGKLASLKRFKDDAKEVATGYECGIGIESYNDLKVGDIIEAYEIELITQEL